MTTSMLSPHPSGVSRLTFGDMECYVSHGTDPVSIDICARLDGGEQVARLSLKAKPSVWALQTPGRRQVFLSSLCRSIQAAKWQGSEPLTFAGPGRRPQVKVAGPIARKAITQAQKASGWLTDSLPAPTQPKKAAAPIPAAPPITVVIKEQDGVIRLSDESLAKLIQAVKAEPATSEATVSHIDNADGSTTTRVVRRRS